MRALLLVGSALLLCSCATMRPSATYTGLGEADPSRDRKVVSQFRSALDATGDAPVPEAKILMNTIPEGIDVGNDTLQVAAGYRHRVLGRFMISYPMGTPLWFSDYESTGLKVLCYPQVPLVWLTLTLWIAAPTTYPCWGSVLRDKADAVDHVKQLVHSAGGNAAIITADGGDHERTMMLGGYILEIDPEMLAPEKLRTAPTGPRNTTEM